MFYEEIRIKQGLLFPLPLGVLEGLRFVIVALPGLFSYPFFFLHSILLSKYSLQQQIPFNGNIFGNNFCRCNEDSLLI